MAVTRREIGDLLVDNGVLTAEELDIVRAERAQTGDSIAHILSRLGLAGESQLKNALELEFGVNFVFLTKQPVDTSLLQLLPEEVIREHFVVPIAHEGNRLTVAMVDPGDNTALEAVKRCANGASIKTVVCLEDDFQQFLREHYRGSSRATKEMTAAAYIPAAKPATQAEVGQTEPGPDSNGSTEHARPVRALEETGAMPALDAALLRSLAKEESDYAADGPKLANAEEIAAAVKAITGTETPAGDKKAKKEKAPESASTAEQAPETDAVLESDSVLATETALAHEAAVGLEATLTVTEDIPGLTDFAPEQAPSPNLTIEEAEREQKEVDTGSFPTITEQDAERHLAKQFEATRTQDLSELELARRAQEEAIVLLANQILGGAIKRHCSNIHITPGDRQAVVHYRQNGQLYVDRRLPNAILTSLTARYKMMARMSLSETKIPQDGHIKVKSASKEIVCLVSTVPTEKGEHVLIWIV